MWIFTNWNTWNPSLLNIIKKLDETNFGIDNNWIAKTQIQFQVSLYELFFLY